MNKYLLFQTEYYSIFLNEEDQYYLGRSVAVLKRKAPSLSEVNPEEWVDLGLVVRIFEKALTKTFGAVNFNWSCSLNTAYKNSPPNPQVYWHVRPRYSSQVKVSNRVFKDNLFGSHYQTKRMLLIQPELLSEISEKIRENI
jgi:diadenosine tetraphosphate (Ap4A) HIT family hydrolase